MEIGGVMMVPLIVGMVEVAKRAGLPVHYAALLSLCLGLALSMGRWLTAQSGLGGLFDAGLVGLALGLSASGLYSVAHSVERASTRTDGG
jgi:hypothetical protein